MTKYIILFFLLIVSNVYAQNFTGGFVDFGPNYSTQIYNDINGFNGSGVLGASDVTVQDALQTLENMKQSDIPCLTTDDWCFEYDTPNRQLVLYVNSVIQAKWPQTASAGDFLLLESGDKILLENGTDAIFLE